MVISVVGTISECHLRMPTNDEAKHEHECVITVRKANIRNAFCHVKQTHENNVIKYTNTIFICLLAFLGPSI